ncbi:MAG: DUF2793 domain-containing protein [Deinococcus-Thermus bacterium]|nr:DUF2793 domain-containing protein [Deinococcota bacterium]
MNEALVRLDAAAQLVLEEVGGTEPPASPVPGACYAVGAGATGHWAGQEGRVAVADNGGWVFLDPRSGWRARDNGTGRAVLRVGGEWVADGLSRTPSGAAARFETIEALHDVVAGAENVTSVAIPARVILFAVSARVVSDVTGAVTAWRFGEAGATGRFGSGLGLPAGSYADGLLGQPQAYYAPSPLVIAGEGGDLAGGRIRFAIHYLAFDLPGT